MSSPSNVNPRSRQELEDGLATERQRREAMSDRDAILATLASLDVEAYLRAGGLSEEDVLAARARLL